MMDYKNRSFTILGAGRSGIAAARLLKKHGADVFISDGGKKENLIYLDENILKNEGIKFETGGHTEKVFKADALIKSPGISPDSAVILGAIKNGLKIYSEIEIAFNFCKAPVIAVTGTNGKTTTTVLTGEIFRKAGRKTFVCGNVGTAFSEIAELTDENSIVVLEVSSFQLNDTETFRPKVSVMLNVTPDHLDWHKNFENYINAKFNIMKNQKAGDTAAINYDDIALREKAGRMKKDLAFFSVRENLKKKGVRKGSFAEEGKIYYFDNDKGIDEEIMQSSNINIRGMHNLYNSLAAIISARAFEIKNEIIENTLKEFKGVEHRIEFVNEINGVMYFNDSKATNIDSLIVALESFDKNIILILGGREKDNDYSKVEKLIESKVKMILAIGESRDKIINHFEGKVKVLKSDSMKDAVRKAYENSIRGDKVLLSPACKSFDMYANFEERGRDYKSEVNKL
ncbi:MAG: UDP-N-acetylmuramoylalanine--D-glutamate ligase [Ignavibacteria bacterium]|nr:UDP-N-acetylmuramoylalanine--D-glutamate ligase [Ignavibacteria bacterium]